MNKHGILNCLHEETVKTFVMFVLKALKMSCIKNYGYGQSCQIRRLNMLPLIQEFEASGNHNLEKARTSGSLKTKLKCPAYGKLCCIQNNKCIGMLCKLQASLSLRPGTQAVNWMLSLHLSHRYCSVNFLPYTCMCDILQKVEGLKFTLSSEWFPTSG